MLKSHATNTKYYSLNDQINMQLLSGWKIQSSEVVKDSGNYISSNSYKNRNWYKAHAPGTVLDVLLKNDVYKNPFLGTNLQKINVEPFKNSWWYKTSFDLADIPEDSIAILAFDGINYKADIWLNGTQIAGSNTVEGPFRRFKFEVSDSLIQGKNILAVEVFPPHPGQFSIGFVDWNPKPPDQNMGIFRPVNLTFVDKVKIENPFIKTKLDLNTLKHADLEISAEVVNYSNKNISGKLKGIIEAIYFEKEVLLFPKSRQKLVFSSDDFAQLRIPNPRLWWPNNFGDPNLYDLKLDFETENYITDSVSQFFGIRSVEDYINDEGHR